ncbi:MAG: strawberry notch C-terminal domain-containing protein, partial [Flavobacteriia bacterium]|nr:strawberry notch C-terminal domain-containing protein [Flavobacteriia bacterium]
MNNAPYNKYNFILSIIGFIGSIGFYFGVLSSIYTDDPEKQLIEELKKENQFLKQQLEQSTTNAMITRRNYYRVMQNVDIASLPVGLQREILNLDEITENGNSWKYFTTPQPAFDFGDEVYPHRKGLLDFFNRLEEYLKKNNPQALQISGRPKKETTLKVEQLPNEKRPQFRINSIRTGLYFLRKSNALHNTKQTREDLLSLLNELQLSIEMGQIVLYDFHLVIEKIQEEISDFILAIKVDDTVPKLLKFSPRTVAMIKAGLKQEEQLSSLPPRNIKPNKNDPEFLKAIKIYHKYQGRVITHNEVRQLRQEFEKATAKRTYSDYEFDPYYPQYNSLLKKLEQFNLKTMSNKSMLPISTSTMNWRYAYDEKAKNFLRKLTSEGELMGLSGTRLLVSNRKQEQFANILVNKLSLNIKLNRPQTEKIANEIGIFNKTMIKELTEYAIVKRGREIALGEGSVEEKFQQMVNLYNHQTNISFRTSQSILLKQYSTPVPIGYLMGIYCRLDKKEVFAFEPSAGNGMLTIAGNPKQVRVNEIDRIRRENLKRQKFSEVFGLDASEPMTGIEKAFPAVLTNPPFGKHTKPLYVDNHKIYDLDHAMTVFALQTMKDSGRSAIIVGGHLKYDSRGRIVAGKDRIFFNYLYSRFNVEDVIALDGRKLYAKQGTTFDVTLILINGRKNSPKGVAPLFDAERNKVVRSFDELFERIMNKTNQVPSVSEIRQKALDILAKLKGKTLEGPYTPSSKGTSLQTQVPDSMDFELHQSLKQITQDVGGDMDNFVRHRLGYPTKQALHNVLGAEQIDVVGMAIYNIEALNQGIIVGDQTGIGKGRVAASMIRYSCQQGVKPIFITVGVNLFSDIYRDLEAIGSADLVPFIVNARESKTDVKDEDGLVLFQAPTSIEQQRVFESNDLSGYDFVMATYSQFNSPEKKQTKPAFLKQIAKDSIVIMDESHIASGSSNTGQLMQEVVRSTKGAVFLSATFAKRPDNMPIYALKTAISEANMSRSDLVSAITKGGVALQEILSAQLVAEGQMVRRERSYEGIEVNYITLDSLAQEHSAIADNITAILRKIIRFQNLYVDQRVTELDELMASEGAEVKKRGGTENAGVDNMPYFSKVFNVINQMLFSIKADAVADRAIERLKEGKKPVIAFSSTMGSFLEQMQDEDGIQASIGDTINADFAVILEKGIEGVLRYTVTEPNGEKTYLRFDPQELGAQAKEEYDQIRMDIKTISSGISISPIDVIVQKIEGAGYSVGEVTGRKLKLKLNGKKGIIEHRKRFNTNDVFRKFNNNEVDVLLINQSGSTGASAHAVPTPKVPTSKVKQRVMIVLQPELDINIEIQKRGRINRTGQIVKPIYDYMNSAIPAEKRLMMMLQKKLKSLDANTSSNQKQSSSILSVPDFLNKYGDSIIVAYLKENPEMNELLGDPIKISASGKIKSDSKEDVIQKEDSALKVSGRIAVLSTKMQEDFYNEISERYENLVNYLKQTGDYDLEVEEMDLKAKTISS